MNFAGPPKNKKEIKQRQRLSHENEKEDLTGYYIKQGYDKKNLNTFLVNSLKDHYEEELKEDGLL